MRLVKAGIALGLVSGAMEGAARTKLTTANLNRFFVFGGYGSDSPDRLRLTNMAMNKASQFHDGLLDPDEVFVVGDTPLDVSAAKRARATAVGVASGGYTISEQHAVGPITCFLHSPQGFPGSRRS